MIAEMRRTTPRLRWAAKVGTETEAPITIKLLVLMLLTFGLKEVVKPSLALTPSEGVEP